MQQHMVISTQCFFGCAFGFLCKRTEEVCPCRQCAATPHNTLDRSVCRCSSWQHLQQEECLVVKAARGGMCTGLHAVLLRIRHMHCTMIRASCCCMHATIPAARLVCGSLDWERQSTCSPVAWHTRNITCLRLWLSGLRALPVCGCLQRTACTSCSCTL